MGQISIDPPQLPANRIIAHRGASAFAPENTFAALRAAARLGATWVEVDVKLTSDGVAILHHDAVLGRTADGSGAVADTPWDRIRQLDAGSWFTPGFAGEPVPRLDDALRLCCGLGLSMNLEIKPCPGREAETTAELIRVVRQTWPDNGGRLLLSSFQLESLEEAQRIGPELPRALLIREPRDGWLEDAERLGCWSLNVNHKFIHTAEMLGDIKTKGFRVLGYTVNDCATATRLLADGMDAVISDNPLVF
ncbi:MAG: glycerophosphodiester phosphodiesterase [Rhodospirillaceae bacterium]|nr:glycerophosphodiester phosphodiesterase [Rhodospirillaceae bacterium]